MFVLFAIILSTTGAVSTSVAEFTSEQRCEEAKAAIAATTGPVNKILVCSAK